MKTFLKNSFVTFCIDQFFNVLLGPSPWQGLSTAAQPVRPTIVAHGLWTIGLRQTVEL